MKMHMSAIENLPTISVIVPVYNSADNLPALIECLLDQDYPKDKYQLIFVDNNSIDSSREIISSYPVKLLTQNEIQSSYAARNTGILFCDSELIVFIDADCIASRDWLREGVAHLMVNNADMVGGKIQFTYSSRKTDAELYDSVTHIQMKKYIENSGTAMTANLFVKSIIFEKIGLFPETVKSGGDTQWTAKATQSGFSLIYCESAIVKHPARRLFSLLKKNIRVGTGLIASWKSKGWSVPVIFFSYLKLLLPPRIEPLKAKISEQDSDEMQNKVFSFYWISYLCKLAMAIGISVSIFKIHR